MATCSVRAPSALEDFTCGQCPQAAAGSGGAQGMEQPEVAASLRIKVLVKFNGQVKVRPKRDSFLGF